MIEKGNFKITRECQDQEIEFKPKGDTLEIEAWDGNNDAYILFTLDRQEWWKLGMWLFFHFRSG